MRDDDGAQLVADHAAIETASGGARACLPGSGAARAIYPHHRRHAGIRRRSSRRTGRCRTGAAARGLDGRVIGDKLGAVIVTHAKTESSAIFG